MPELVTASAAREEPQQKLRTHSSVEGAAPLTIVAAVAMLAALVSTAHYAQGQDRDKYSLKSPSGIAFSDFRGYEDWTVVSSARTDEILKVIVANPAMITGYKAGAAGNGEPFPDGSMIVKPSGSRRGARRRLSSWRCRRSSRRLSSWKRIARDFRKAAGGDTRYSTTTPHRTSSRPIPRASQIAEMPAIQP
jgi:Cytochrome P460